MGDSGYVPPAVDPAPPPPAQAPLSQDLFADMDVQPAAPPPAPPASGEGSSTAAELMDLNLDFSAPVQPAAAPTPPPGAGSSIPLEPMQPAPAVAAASTAAAPTSGDGLQFQSFSTAGGQETGKISSALPPPEPDFEAQAPPRVQPGDAPVYSVRYYQPYFEVSTRDVLDRIRRSLMPWKSTFFEAGSGENPDLYGPFWVTTTLIFLVGVCTNIALKIDDANADYELERVTVATPVLYAYAFLVPLLVWLLFKYFDVPCSFSQLVCIYGYCLFPFIPAAFLCTVPLEVVRWIAIILACVVSLSFLVVNLWPLMKAHMPDKGIFWMLGMAGLHGGLSLGLKLYFFEANSVPAA
eukprot:GFYU01000489.1.p1 GENE.GFYU01000489.1~~GFYU01000489.1.p1  ORF type:complete len:352 (+),score=62.93 GFYU01000489.1:110-1165(+)